MIAFLFPGQGSQAVGMGRGFYESSPGAKALFEEANAALGFDLTKLAFEGPEAELALTANTQPAVLAEVERLCAEAANGEVVEVANVNSAQQIVVAGHRAAVERAVGLAGQRGGKKSVVLPVSAPFHCALMAPAAERLRPELEGIAVADPRIPVVRNVDA